MALECRVVLAGEDLTDVITKGNEINPQLQTGKRIGSSKLILGPGLIRCPTDNRIRATKCGHLYTRPPSFYWVASHQKDYYPVLGDRVLGTVVSRGPLHARVDIGACDYVNLSLLAFEGATKKNKPEIHVGDVVLGRVIQADKDLDAELACVSTGGKRDGLGLLASSASVTTHSMSKISLESKSFQNEPNNGYLFTLPIDTVRELIHPNSTVISELGKRLRFEISCGHNGRVWVKATSIENTMLIVNTLTSCERHGFTLPNTDADSQMDVSITV